MFNIKPYIIKEKDAIKKAIKMLQKNDIKVLTVIDVNQKLCGTITDGDIRRGLIKGKTTDNYCHEIMNKKPSYAVIGDDIKINKILQNKKIDNPILVDKDNKVVGIYSSSYKKPIHSKDNMIIIMAGGEGKRLLPLTSDKPKPLLTINNVPIISMIIDRFLDNGYKNIHVSVRYKSEKLIDYFNKDKYRNKINILKERSPLGTAGCLSLINKNLCNEPVIVINGDIITKVNYDELLKYHVKLKSMITLCVTDYVTSVPFGIIKIKNHRIEGLEEKPISRHLINAGIYIINPEVIKSMKKNKKIDMTELISLYIQKKQVGVFPLHEPWIDIGSHEDYDKAQNI